MILVDALVEASKKLSCAETIEEADRALSDLESYPSIAAVLSDILVRRNGTALSVEALRKEVDAANEQMPPYKRVKRIVLREEEFEKTSTMKIKRFGNNMADSQNGEAALEK